jgi:hypothetical protein
VGTAGHYLAIEDEHGVIRAGYWTIERRSCLTHRPTQVDTAWSGHGDVRVLSSVFVPGEPAQPSSPPPPRRSPR